MVAIGSNSQGSEIPFGLKMTPLCHHSLECGLVVLTKVGGTFIAPGTISCDTSAHFFADKVSRICCDLDVSCNIGTLGERPSTPSGLFKDSFDPVSVMDVHEILESLLTRAAIINKPFDRINHTILLKQLEKEVEHKNVRVAM